MFSYPPSHLVQGPQKKGGIFMQKNLAYTTQMEAARKKILKPQMARVSEEECIASERLMELVAKGQVVIPCNKRHTAIHPKGIGRVLRTKINVNLGASKDCRYTRGPNDVHEPQLLQIICAYRILMPICSNHHFHSGACAVSQSCNRTGGDQNFRRCECRNWRTCGSGQGR